jgi:hypothetical protein
MPKKTFATMDNRSARPPVARMSRTAPLAKVLRVGWYTSATTPPPAESLAALPDLSRLRVEWTRTLSTLKRKIHVLDRIFPEWPRLWGNPFGASARASVRQ